jgi:hypothetical protein
MIRLYKRLRCALWYGEHDYAEIDTHCPRVIAGFCGQIYLERGMIQIIMGMNL